MKFEDIERWSSTLDHADETPLPELPSDAEPGVLWEEPVEGGRRLWRRVEIVSGITGGRWAYWKQTADSIQRSTIPHPEGKAIADRIFNGDAPHFIGMLAIPYTHIPYQTVLAWVLVDPKLVPPRPIWVIEEKLKTRYEKSKTVFDAETQESTEL
jgi:hypothetical protein